MKINNHAVAMNAQYYNVSFESTQTKITDSKKEFVNSESSQLHAIERERTQLDRDHQELSRELSKALMKNISSKSSRLTGDRVEVTLTQAESQKLNFSVSAIVQAEGKEISLSLDVSLSRSFVKKEFSVSSLGRNLFDPLVINLNGQMPTLNSKTMSFDIDSDGKSDQISQLNTGNVFLTLDKNENRKVDDGSELFGTKSGDGFADLAKYDEDNNGWIDENDPIFDKLRIWEGNAENKELIALGEVGIGAIFLGNTQTPFSLKDETNTLLGEIRSSSFILFENGQAGLISQVDLAITKETKSELLVFSSLQKEVNLVGLNALYSKDDTQNSSQSQQEQNRNKIQTIQGKIKGLESDLRRADDGAKPGIQARIGALNAQMMSLLESSL